MRRQVDHHLARARAIGRRASAHARTTVWESLEAVQRALDRLYEDVTVDIAGDHHAQVRVERQDLDEMIGNLVENAAKYGGGRVFVMVEPRRGRRHRRSRTMVREYPVADRGAIFDRARGSTRPASPEPASASRSSATLRKSTAARITLEESEDLGGLLARLECFPGRLPPAVPHADERFVGSSAAAHCSHGPAVGRKASAFRPLGHSRVDSEGLKSMPSQALGTRDSESPGHFRRRRSRRASWLLATWGYAPLR